MSEWLTFVKAYAEKKIMYLINKHYVMNPPHIKQEMKRNQKKPLKKQNGNIIKKWLKILL